jgi:signal transduction histidine kinase
MMEKITSQSRFDRLVRATQELSLARSVNKVMEIVRSVSRELTGADGATFVLKDKDMCFYADEEAIAPLFKGQRFPLRMCISGWSMINKRHVTISDIYLDPRVPHEVYRPTFVKSLLMVPIRKIDPVGAIGTYWANYHVPDEEEVTILQALADITAVTLENINVYSELEERVKQRTHDLEEMNRELESFSYSVSHDLRAPLRAINGYMEMLMEDHSGGWNENAIKLADRVVSNAKEMTGLIDSLLAFFKMGKSELTKTNVDLAALLPEICDGLREQEKDRDIEIVIGSLPAVMADYALLKQVWQNLISNALKYTGKKTKARIEIGVKNINGQNAYYVKDNGSGFDMAYYNKLFGVFQRLHSQREFEGTGIGLATVEKIVKKHGGSVWAESKIDQGATFYFTLE